MTEAEWLACEDPTPMLKILRGKASDRKLRLFAVCSLRCYSSQFMTMKAEWADVITTGESFADGLLSQEQLGQCDALAVDMHMRTRMLGLITNLDTQWSAAFALGLWSEGAKEVFVEGKLVPTPQEISIQVALLRDIFGNPFRPITLGPSWLTSTVVSLAQQMYDSRDFSAMPILADALQDAGCDNADILDHCRGAGPHTRGCWVVDKLLSRE